MSIDYGRGLTNIDHATGIRYGVISQHSVSGDALNDLTTEYGDPACPTCGGAVVAADAPEADADWNDGKDYACLACQVCYWSDRVFPDEPIGLSYTEDGYRLTDCLDSDLFVLASPFYTYAPFCSPCVPGAGNLDEASPDAKDIRGVRTYCLGHDWFENGVAPYPIFRVADDTVVVADAA